MKEDNNYYIIPDEESENEPDSYVLDEDELPDSEDLTSSYSLPEERIADDATNEEEKEEEAFDKYIPLKLTAKILLRPVEGWKSLNRDKTVTPIRLMAYSLMPSSALAALSVIAQWIYGLKESLRYSLFESIEVFIAYILSYYCVLLGGRILLGRKIGDRLDDRYGRGLVILSLSTLAFFFSLVNFLPMLEPVLVFLPIWTIYSVTRGVKYLRLPDNRSTIATFVIVALLIGFPLLLDHIFSLFE